MAAFGLPGHGRRPAIHAALAVPLLPCRRRCSAGYSPACRLHGATQACIARLGNASALAFFAFVRTFAQTWGITIASTILQNELTKRLPPAFIELVPGGLDLSYAAIPLIKDLHEPLRTQVRVAFADSLSTIWKTMIGICGMGFLSLFLLKEIPMSTATNEKFGLHDGEKLKSAAIDSGESMTEKDTSEANVQPSDDVV